MPHIITVMSCWFVWRFHNHNDIINLDGLAWWFIIIGMVVFVWKYKLTPCIAGYCSASGGSFWDRPPGCGGLFWFQSGRGLDCSTSLPRGLKVRLHGTRQAARLVRDMLQRDLLRGNSVYMVGSCRARLLHIIHVSAVFRVGVPQRKLRQMLATACAARQL